MKLFGKVAACIALLGVLCVSPAAGGLFSVQAKAATQEAAAQPVATQPAGSTGSENNNGFLGWGIFLYASGEVAASIALGIAHARKVKRQEQQEKVQQPVKDANRLPLYAEYQAAMAAAK